MLIRLINSKNENVGLKFISPTVEKDGTHKVFTMKHPYQEQIHFNNKNFAEQFLREKNKLLSPEVHRHDTSQNFFRLLKKFSHGKDYLTVKEMICFLQKHPYEDSHYYYYYDIISGFNSLIISKSGKSIRYEDSRKNTGRLLGRGGTVTAFCPKNIFNRSAMGALKDEYAFNKKIGSEKELIKEQAENSVFVTQETYIEFVLDGFYYTYSADENPLFPFNYSKSKMENKKCIVVLRESDECDYDNPKKEYKVWFWDALWTQYCGEEDIKEAANLLLNFLVNCKVGVPAVDKKKVRVSNIYNNGYHYEIKTSPIKYTCPEENITCYYF